MCRATTDTPPGMGLALVAVMRGWRPSTPCPECFTAPPSLQIAGYPGRWDVAAYLEAGKVKVSCWQAQLHTRQAQRRQCTRQLCQAGQHPCWCALHQPPCGCVQAATSWIGTSWIGTRQPTPSAGCAPGFFLPAELQHPAVHVVCQRLAGCGSGGLHLRWSART